MKIALLSIHPENYSARRLVEAAQKRGHHIEVIHYLECHMMIASHRPQIFYRGRALDEFDAVIPRIGASHTFYGTAVTRQFEMMNVFAANSSQSISRSRDKLRCLQILARKGIGLPVTCFAHDTGETGDLISGVGGAPLVIKLVEGTQGIGVVLAENDQAAQSVIEAFRGLDAYILVQEFIKEAKGADLRCFVVDGKVVAAMKRQAPPGEFRSNLHRGGSSSKIKLSPEERSAATRASKAMGLRVAGVDLLRSNHGPVIMELNSSPGLEGIEKATEVDVAGKIIQFIEKNAEGGSKQDTIKA